MERKKYLKPKVVVELIVHSQDCMIAQSGKSSPGVGDNESPGVGASSSAGVTQKSYFPWSR